MSSEAADQEAVNAVFREVVSLLEQEEIPYAVGGSIATNHWTGSSEPPGDVDIVVREDDAVTMLRVLEKAGFDTQETQHSWVHKAFKNSVTVDLIFQLKNEAILDDAFVDHRSRAEMMGTIAHVMSAEDQIAALAATVDRQTVGAHWYTIIDLMSEKDLDWSYLLSRIEKFPLRALGILYFALDEQVPVEKSVLQKLASQIED